MEIKTGDLPGIGKRYSFETAEGENLVVILHQSGHREIYHFAGSDEDEPDFVLKLSDEEAPTGITTSGFSVPVLVTGNRSAGLGYRCMSYGISGKPFGKRSLWETNS